MTDENDALREEPVVTRILTAADAGYFANEVYGLLQTRLSHDDLKPVADMVRWLTTPDSELYSCFMVASQDSHPVGFLYLHKRCEVPFAFVSYLVVQSQEKPGLGTLKLVSSSLLRQLTRQMTSPDCALNSAEGFLIEMEHPNVAETEKERRRRIARFRRFETLARENGFQLRVIAVPYLQPPLSAASKQEGIPHMLVLGRETKGTLSSTLTREQVIRVLEAVYLRLYPSGYSDDPSENDAFSRTCHTILSGIVRNLPDKVDLLGYRSFC
jgi:hypothetical protein